jgi:hypothetical protein
MAIQINSPDYIMATRSKRDKMEHIAYFFFYLVPRIWYSVLYLLVWTCLTPMAARVWQDTPVILITRGFLCGVWDHDHLSMPSDLSISDSSHRKYNQNMTCNHSHIRTIAHQKMKPKTNYNLQSFAHTNDCMPEQNPKQTWLAIIRTYERWHARK